MNYFATKCRTTSLEEDFDHGDARNIASTSEAFFGQADAPSPAPEVASTPHTGIPTTVDHAGNIPSAGETFLTPVVAPYPAREAASSPHPHSRIPPTVDPASATFSGVEIEQRRDVEGNPADLVASPTSFMPSPRPSEGLGSPSVMISSTGRLSTPGPVSSEPSRSMFQTPETIDEGLGAENLTLSDIPEQTSAVDEVGLSVITSASYSSVIYPHTKKEKKKKLHILIFFFSLSSVFIFGLKLRNNLIPRYHLHFLDLN